MYLTSGCVDRAEHELHDLLEEGGLLAAVPPTRPRISLGARLVVQRLLELVAHHSTRRAPRTRGAPLLTDPAALRRFLGGGGAIPVIGDEIQRDFRRRRGFRGF